MNTTLKDIFIDISHVVPEKEKKKPIWERGYNEEYDIVVISYTKRIGKIVDIDGMRIALPEVPKKKDILFSEKQKKAQKWERKELPEELKEVTAEAAKEASEAKKNKRRTDVRTPDDIYYSRSDAFIERWDKYIDEEFRRRKEGVWFMNNGEPVYITGGHYMFMQWSKLQRMYYADYRFPQMVIYIFWEACKADKRSFGMCYVKNRRSGFSTINCCDNVDFATINRSKYVGIISKTGDDAKSMFMKMVTPVYLNYPFFFKVSVDGTTNPRTQLAFREPAQRIKGTGAADAGGNNSLIEWHATDVNSMDGEEVNKAAVDESGKWPKHVALSQYWLILRKTLLKGVVKVGKCMMGSTVNAPEEGGEEFKKVYYDSKPETRSPITKQTKSGLNSLFIPTEYNTAGKFDIYGNPILYDTDEPVMTDAGETTTVGSISYWKSILEQYKDDPDGLNEARRLDPSTEEDAFLVPSDNCLFNQTNIESQKSYNDSKFNFSTRKSLLYQVGDLVWIEKYKKVEFVQNPKGKFLVSEKPPKDLKNRMEIERGKKSPANTIYFVGGVDSYDIKATTTGRGSKGSFHIYARGAYPYAPNRFVLEYCDRPQSAEMFYDNVLKGLVYYGCQALIENNKGRILHWLKDKGFRRYVMNRPDKRLNELSPTERDLGGVPSSTATIPTQAEMIENHINRHVGLNENPEFGEIGEMGGCYFNTLLDDWLRFDITNREKFDRSVSSGLALWGDNRMISKNQKEKTKRYTYFRKKL